MDALTCLLGVTACKSPLNCISHSPNTTLLLNVTKHFIWTFKSLWPLVICSCRRIKLIWSCSLSCKNSHLWEMTLSLLFFIMKRSEGNASWTSDPQLTQSLWLILKTLMHSKYAVIKSPAGDDGAGSREELLKIQKCHQPHRGNVSQGTLTRRQLNWLRLVPNQTAFYSSTTKKPKTIWQDWRQNKIKKPQNLIILSWEPLS